MFIIKSISPREFAIEREGTITYLNKADFYLLESGVYVFLKFKSDDSTYIGFRFSDVTTPATLTTNQLYTAIYAIIDSTSPDYNNLIHAPSSSTEFGFLLMGG